MNRTDDRVQEIIENYRSICRSEPEKIENWLNLGRFLVDRRFFDEAETALTKIFEEGRFFSFKSGLPRLRFSVLFHWSENQLLFARTYSDLALISVNQGNLAEAERMLVMALRVFERQGQDYEYVRASNRLGMIYRLVGAFESAEEAHYRAKALSEKNGWRFAEAETLGHLGMVYDGRELFEQAIQCHRDALTLYAENTEKHRFEMACEYRQIGLCLLRWGKTDEALEALNLAFEFSQQTDDGAFQSRVLNVTALAFQTKGDLKTALIYAQKALDAALLCEDGFETAVNRLLIAQLKMDETPDACDIEQLLRQAADYFKKAGRREEIATASASLGLYFLRRKDWNAAESFFRDSLHIEQRLHRSLGIASDYGNLGLLASKKGDKEKAADCWRHAAAMFEKSGDVQRAADFKKLIKALEEAPIPAK